MKHLVSKMFLLVMLMSFVSNAQIYVDTAGSDTNPGTIDMPLKTIAKALTLAKADSIIYIRGGIHKPTATLSTPSAGTAGHYIKIFGYPGEKAIIDFSLIGTGSRGLYITKNYLYVKDLEIMNSKDNGIYIRGSYNIIENCRLHHNTDSGLQISEGGAYNKIINCDSYLNYDGPTHGENADGFAAKLNIGLGNIFFGCRAWSNADDGWDLYEGQSPVIIDYCWAFKNGINVWGDPSFQGDGNGFKVGGNNIPAAHIVQRSIAFYNRGKGFDQNNNTAGITVYNCTGFQNTGNNFSFPTSPTTGKHVIKNNISFPVKNNIFPLSDTSHNSWKGFSVAAGSFVSTDTLLAYSSRNADSTLPREGFLAIKDTSLMVDAGVDVGLPFNGTAPDLGAYETGPEIPLYVNNNIIDVKSYGLLQNYPNPFNPSTTLTVNLANSDFITLKIYDITGRVVAELFNGERPAGAYNFYFNASGLSSGVYFASLVTSEKTQIIKLLLMK